nr:hypothetical protein [uncultured Desulfobacter sp.]
MIQVVFGQTLREHLRTNLDGTLDFHTLHEKDPGPQSTVKKKRNPVVLDASSR